MNTRFREVMTWAGLAVLVSFFFLLLASRPAHAEIVKYVHDGDTITLMDGKIIRISCIDAPELLQKPYGKESGAFLRAAIKGKDVTLVYELNDKGLPKKDSYKKRFLAKVVYAGVDMGLLMVKEGQAFVYDKCADPEYTKAQDAAKASKKGFWSNPPENPKEFRKKLLKTYGGR